MSAILSAESLNDFISPSVACIKPVETLPEQGPSDAYEVTTEDKVQAAAPAQISLTDCLACSGCVTSAEAVLVSLQSYQEVLSTLDAYPEIVLPAGVDAGAAGAWQRAAASDGKIFVASVSPQARASIAATFGVSERAAGNMIQRLLSGSEGLRSGGLQGSGFTWVLDTNIFREMALVAAADELDAATAAKAGNQEQGDFARRISPPRKPVLTSACPGWICYAEKTHPHVLPHISKIKSPQALAGTLVKSVLSKRIGIAPNKIWHMAVMPCFDKKLEASREEFTDAYWSGHSMSDGTSGKDRGVRDVDLVITARELLSLAENRGIHFPSISHRPLTRSERTPFPDAVLDSFLFPRNRKVQVQDSDSGSSGGYLHHIARTLIARNPGARLNIQRGRNADVVEYTVTTTKNGTEQIIFRAARYYGFRNIQNLVRRLRPAKQSRLGGAAVRRGPGARPGAAAAPPRAVEVDGYDYVEVMACPGGCTNGGGQIKVQDLGSLGVVDWEEGAAQRAWLKRVDEAYFSMEESSDDDATDDEEAGEGVNGGNEDVEMVDGEQGSDEEVVVDGIDRRAVKGHVKHWVDSTGVELDRLVCTTYRKVESDVGKKGSDMERVAGLASSIGGGW